MKIHEVILRDYKPLLHNNIRNIHIKDIPQITILVGPNGWGKSSILRALSPYPATRSDYGKKGLKVLHITHENVNYTLTSDFSKSPAHSFIRDGEELNVSGTTEVQNDLTNTYFNYSKLLDSLLLGNYKITNMGRPARRELFMATYPGSLAFVLAHYTRLSTILRSTASQLKLLKERQSITADKLIDNSTLKMYGELKADMDKMIAQFDQNIYLCNNLLTDIRSKKDKLKSVEDLKLEYFKNKTSMLRYELAKLKSTKGYELTYRKTIDLTVNTINNTLKSLSTEYNVLLDRAKGVREEIEKYNKYLSTNIEDDIKRCENIIQMQSTILKNKAVDPDIPVMSYDTFTYISNRANIIEENIQWLASYGQHWTKEEHKARQLEQAQLKMNIQQAERSLNQALGRVSIAKTNLSRSGYDNYPKDCTWTCGLKKQAEDAYHRLRKEIEAYDLEIRKLNKDLEIWRKSEIGLNNSLQGRATAEAKMELLGELLSRYDWGFYVLNNLTIISAINSQASMVWNRLVKVLKNTKNHKLCKEAQETINATQLKLDNLKATEVPARALISTNLVKKEVELNQIHKKLDHISDTGKKIQHKRDGYNKQSDILRSIAILKDTMNTWISYKQLESEEQLLLDNIDHLNGIKTEVNEKLRSIESILLEQRGYLTILNDELAPTIKKLESDIEKLTIITDQLSPTSGIPFRYTIQYINDIFTMANKFIKHVWEHDLELIYFTDEDTLDFIFKLMINNSSELKDINMCSKGQKSLIDLVINLSICIYRGYAQTHPLKLDEIDDGLTPEHQARLTQFLGDLLQQNTINQAFIMNHHLSVSTSFKDAGVISLSPDDIIPAGCKVISKIN